MYIAHFKGCIPLTKYGQWLDSYCVWVYNIYIYIAIILGKWSVNYLNADSFLIFVKRNNYNFDTNLKNYQSFP